VGTPLPPRRPLRSTFKAAFAVKHSPLYAGLDLAKPEDPARDISDHDWRCAQSNPIRGWDRRHDRYENFRIIAGRCRKLHETTPVLIRWIGNPVIESHCGHVCRMSVGFMAAAALSSYGFVRRRRKPAQPLFQFIHRTNSCFSHGSTSVKVGSREDHPGIVLAASAQRTAPLQIPAHEMHKRIPATRAEIARILRHLKLCATGEPHISAIGAGSIRTVRSNR
jgi:hypothetical protein